MIYLITATPGSGKTLWAVKEIFSRVNEAESWNIFTNIDGIKLDTAQSLKDSFEDYPPRSLVVIDEAQKITHFSKKYKHPVKNANHPEVEFLQTHRHADHLDIIFITQAPRLLNPDVLDMVGTHYHLHRPMGMKMATWWMWKYHQLNPNTKSTKSDAEDTGTFTYPKHLFGMYKSSDGGTDSHGKIKIPMKIINAIWMLVVILGVTGWIYMKNAPSQQAKDENKQTESIKTEIPKTANSTISNLDQECRKGANVEKPECVEWFDNLSKQRASVKENSIQYNPNKPYDVSYTPQMQPTDFPRMSGVIKLSSGKLMAIDQQGNYMPDVSSTDCQKWLNGYRPFNYFATNNTSTERVSTSEQQVSAQETSSL